MGEVRGRVLRHRAQTVHGNGPVRVLQTTMAAANRFQTELAALHPLQSPRSDTESNYDVGRDDLSQVEERQ